MSVQPAYEIDLEHGGRTVTLRASLRAATTLENMPGGIAGAYEGLLTQSLTTIRTVILAAAADRQEARTLLAAIAGKPLSRFVPDAQAACLAILAALIQAGEDSADEAPSQGGDEGAAMPMREYFAQLFQYATGWLGWTPTETWAASPAEIETAFRAHIDRLVKLTPGATGTAETTTKTDRDTYTPERLRQIEEQGHDPAFDREGLRRLKAQQHG
ncbi:hypothetical protein JHW45_10710 [Paracoccus stylophorae]|uniref:Tail assembly chaperone n=1 Tax=Paracoccus stylophorae TaxID=659350 RepID=A0ABY7SRD8_9RHOB|nr:hypothetical protein [Paracoccus stylophorae]WCR09587.1 hypothetical protein JHW45_10710 [Paracoccus stylophorae]